MITLPVIDAVPTSRTTDFVSWSTVEVGDSRQVAGSLDLGLRSPDARRSATGSLQPLGADAAQNTGVSDGLVDVPLADSLVWRPKDEATFHDLVVRKASGTITEAEEQELARERSRRFRLRCRRSAEEQAEDYRRQRAIQSLEVALSEYFAVIRPSR